MKMEQTECSKISVHKFQTPGNHPQQRIQHSEHGESLKTSTLKEFEKSLLFRHQFSGGQNNEVLHLLLCTGYHYSKFGYRPTQKLFFQYLKFVSFQSCRCYKSGSFFWKTLLLLLRISILKNIITRYAEFLTNKCNFYFKKIN